jgi:protein-tyrosine phosphatase
MGTLAAMPALRWPDLRNARYLGGLPAGDGWLNNAALVRSDNHSQLGAAGIAALDAHGVSRVIDLRFASEAAKYPSPLARDPRYCLRPACFENEPGAEVPPDSYRQLIDQSRALLGAVVMTIAEASPGAVVVHCHAGRDRTGVVVALVLRIAGVAEDVIGTDYAPTPYSPPTMITNTLDHVDAVYGGVEEYLIGAGVTPAHLNALRGRLVS